MPTILQINSCANWGSTGKIAEQINQVAATQGWKTYIAYGREANPSQSELIHIGSTVSQAIALIEARLFDNDGLANRWATHRLVKKIKKIKPDVVHLHNLHGYYINYKILFDYLNATDIPIVWTLHDCWSFTGHCSHFVFVNCERWKTECGNCPLFNDYPASWWKDSAKRNYELKKRLFSANHNLHIVAVSQWLADLVKQSFLKNADVTIINNGVDLNLFRPLPAPQDSNFKNDKFLILAVSSVWAEGKGLAYYSKLSNYLQDNEELILIGADEFTQKKLPKKIICVPRTNSIEDLVLWYNKADVVLSLSKAETFGLTIAEGFACGTPGIVFDNTALPELVTPETGFVVADGDITALYEKIQIVKNFGNLYYSKACRHLAESRFNKSDRFAEYIELYNRLTIK